MHRKYVCHKRCADESALPLRGARRRGAARQRNQSRDGRRASVVQTFLTLRTRCWDRLDTQPAADFGKLSIVTLRVS